MSNSSLLEFRDQSIDIWKNLGRAQQMVIVGVGVASVVVIVALLFWAKSPEYATLFTNLSDEDAGAIVAKLKENKTPYELANGGSSILVPANLVYDTRLELASAGLPQGGGVGFEIFNQTNFGMTDFVQKVNYQRALEGELSRTISHLGPVEQSRVHIVIPQPTLYTDNQKDTTASVVLKLKPGQRLDDSQIRGISQLISSSVEGLKPENLTIVDSNGNMLSDSLTSNKDARKISASQQDSQKSFETDLEQRVQGMLDKVLGYGKATVRVQALLDWDQYESSSEIYSPGNTMPQIRSSRGITETYGDQPPMVGGVPGTRTNVPGYAGLITTTTATQGQYAKTDMTNNYELSKTVEKTSKAPGSVKRLSVAVVLDSQQTDPTQLDEVKNLVAAAAGIDNARGDVLAISAIPFNRDAFASDAKAMEDAQRWETYLQIGKIAAMAIGPVLLLIILFLMSRRGRTREYRSIRELPDGAPVELPEPTLVAAIEEPMGKTDDEMFALPTQPIEDPQQKFIKEQVVNLVKVQPNVVADLLKTWMKEADA